MQTADFAEKDVNSKPGACGVGQLRLENFRNYRSIQVRLAEGLNVVAGQNAQGKTNLLEALYLLATARVLRGQKDSEAIRDGDQRATVAGELLGSKTELAVVIERSARKKALLNGLALPRAADVLGRIPAVAFTAEDLRVVRGEPSERRLMLDLEMSALYPAYLHHLSKYKRALEQRNALLRAARDTPGPAGAYEPWEAQMAEHGSALRKARQRYIARLEPIAGESHAELAPHEVLTIRYAPHDLAETPVQLNEALEASRSADVFRGGSGVGPHRDDIAIEVDGRDARLFGSQGQQRTATISIKLGVLAVAREELGASPMLLLDDIFSDLDERRREMLVRHVGESTGQVVLTCTEAGAVGPNLLSRAKVYNVHAGEVHEA